MKLSRFEWGCFGVVAAALVVRLTFLIEPNFIWDSAWYLMLARSFGEEGTFLVRWSDPAAPEYSGYWPPLFPIFVSPLVKLFGASFRVLVLGSILAAALLVLGTYLTTRDLFDRPRALAAAALVAASPAFYVSDAKGMSESLLALAVVLTVWAFVRSLERPAFLPLAAGFAFLAYLGKASLGLPIVAAGVVALAAWRVYTRGWRRVLTSPADLGVGAAALAVGGFLALTRTERLGGLGLGLIEPLRRGVLGAECGALFPFESTGAHCWALVFPLKVAFVAAFLLVVTVPLSLRLPEIVRARRTERTDALWLAVLLPIVAGAVFTTTFFFTERRSFVDFDNIRYLTPAIVPFVWLVLPAWSFEDEPAARDTRVRRQHTAPFWAAVAALVVLAVLNPLAGKASLGRFVALSLLGLVPFGLAAVALASRYEIATRRTPSGQEMRFVRVPTGKRDAFMLWLALAFFLYGVATLRSGAGALAVAAIALVPLALARAAATLSTGERLMLRLVAIVFVFGSLYYSSWYTVVAFGLVVALATPSAGRKLVAMALILLVSSTGSADSILPVREANEALAKLPDGTLVGMSELVVFPASAAPDNVAPRLIDPVGGIPPGIDVLLVQPREVDVDPDDFTKVAGWNYRFALTPGVRLRVAIERDVLGRSIEFQQLEGLALYVRNGSELATVFS